MSKSAVLALFTLLLLTACASRQAPPDKPSGQAAASAPVKPKSDCPWLPVTEYMLGQGYQDLLKSAPTSQWLYPIYVGMGSVSWAAGLPFAPAVDALMAPLRIAEPCMKVSDE